MLDIDLLIHPVFLTHSLYLSCPYQYPRHTNTCEPTGNTGLGNRQVIFTFFSVLPQQSPSLIPSPMADHLQGPISPLFLPFPGNSEDLHDRYIFSPYSKLSQLCPLLYLILIPSCQLIIPRNTFYRGPTVAALVRISEAFFWKQLTFTTLC